MPPDCKYTEIEDADGKLKEVTFMPSTIETIDRAFLILLMMSLISSPQPTRG